MPIDLSYSLADQEFARTKSIGIWNVSTQLLGHLANRPELARITVFKNSTQAEVPRLEKVKLVTCDRARGGKFGRMWWDQWGVYSAARRSGNNWLFLPKGYASFVRRCPVKLAAYVHDAMHDHYRRMHCPNPLARETGYFLRSLRATLRQASVVFTNTEFTGGEVRRLASEWHVNCPRVCFAGIGFESPAVGTEGRKGRVLVLAGSGPHKCTALAVDYLTRWAGRRNDVASMDWVGSLPDGLLLPDLPGWRKHPRLTQAEYDGLMQRAQGVVYFSAYEGFGMPPVEATLAGAAAVFSSIPPMREVMGDCGFPFANDSYHGFADSMNRALAAPAERLAAWRSELSRRHRWDLVAERIVRELVAAESEE